MNLQLNKKDLGSPLPSDKAIAAVASDLYAQLRDLGMNPRDVISVASHLLSNVMGTICEDDPEMDASTTH